MQGHKSQNHKTNAATAVLAKVLKAAADPSRLQILRVLSNGSFGVQELAGICGMPQPGVSHHLKILAGANLVETRREGNFVFYRRPAVVAQPLVKEIFRELDQQHLEPNVTKEIQAVHQSRSQWSREFFDKYAHEFQDKQKLICEFDQYGQGLHELIEQWSGARKMALEVGPGQGDLIKVLRKYFAGVTVVDQSQEMLARTKAFCRRYRLTDIQIIAGSIEDLSLSLKPDLVVLNMVLHHIASPPTIFATLAGMLAPGGGLLIADLCRHEQDWVKDACGDLWLGFEPEELTTWACAAGFKVGPRSFLTMKNGFQVQLRLFFN